MSGERIIRISSGDRMAEYGQAKLGDLQNYKSSLIADADGLLDFYGLQAHIARSIIESGEVFIRFCPKRLGNGLAVPLQLQVLESDHLDETYNTVAPNGNEIRMGIEFDKIGRRKAYWMYREHPGESFMTIQNPFDRIRIPATEILHAFQPLRPGQQKKIWRHKQHLCAGSFIGDCLTGTCR
jgi:capsid protein